MRILVDADACPVKEIVEEIAKKYSIAVVMFTDNTHIIKSNYSEIITVDKGSNSADLVLINSAKCGDIVVSSDFGVASLALGKGAKAISFNGLIFSEDNIDRLMFERFLSKKMRDARHGKVTNKGNLKNNEKFEMMFTKLCSGEC